LNIIKQILILAILQLLAEVDCRMKFTTVLLETDAAKNRFKVLLKEMTCRPVIRLTAYIVPVVFRGAVRLALPRKNTVEFRLALTCH